MLAKVVILVCFSVFGIAEDANERILGGTFGPYNGLGSVVRVYVDRVPNCAGSVILDAWVLTAASCLPSYLREASVAIGSVSLNNATRINIVRIYKHPQYKIIGSYDGGVYRQYVVNDIALLRLSESVSVGNRTSLMSLALKSEANQTYTNSTVEVAGWGATSDPSMLYQSNELKVLKMTVGDSCNEIPAEYKANTICSYSTTNDKLCPGDGGDPVVLRTNNSAVQIGIVSWIHRSCRSGESSNTLSTKVAFYIEWMQSIVNGTQT